MKKVAILTICSINYGNRLQNYALQCVLQKLGFEVETLLRKKIPLHIKIKKRIRASLKNDKYSQFTKFDKKIKWSKFIVSGGCITENLADEYDKFVIGSDQIWNMYFDFIGSSDFLPMVEADKKISYAASFGTNTVPDMRKEEIAGYLNDISHIAVREYTGADIIYELTGRRADVVLDPTMLLTREEWESIEKKPLIDMDEPFVFKYILGDDINGAEIEKIARKLNCRIIDINKKEYPIGPAEFIYLLHHSRVVCTDSFHASVFSFLFSKPLVIFDRKSKDKDMSSRINDLCDLLDLNVHRFEDKNYSFQNIMNSNYDIGNMKLEMERSKSLAYLKNALV